MRMVRGAEAVMRPIALSHWCGRVRERAMGSSSDRRTAVPDRHLPPTLTRTLGSACRLRT